METNDIPETQETQNNSSLLILALLAWMIALPALIGPIPSATSLAKNSAPAKHTVRVAANAQHPLHAGVNRG